MISKKLEFVWELEIVFTKDCTQTVLLISLIKTQFVTEEQIRAHHDFFARKDTTLIFQNLHTNNQHPISDVDSVAKGSLHTLFTIVTGKFADSSVCLFGTFIRKLSIFNHSSSFKFLYPSE